MILRDPDTAPEPVTGPGAGVGARHSSGRGSAPLSALVIGTGFGGLAAAVALRGAGIDDITVVEKADRVGGVWRENTYPGAACDVPSSLYSFSFAPNPEWPRRYAQQPDILRYMEDTAQQLGLMDLIRFGTEVQGARWDERACTWQVQAQDSSGSVSWQVDVLVVAVGQLSRPAMPRVPGIDDFDGPAFHSAQWRHDVDLRGKRVGVIGTGASAIQFVPQIQQEAAHVTVFQRSAPHVVPKLDRGYTKAHTSAFRRFPGTQRFGRRLTFTLSEPLNKAMTDDNWVTTAAHAMFRANLRRHVKDPDLRAKLTPDFPIGCKRLLFSNDWYPALAQPNVSVVTDPIEQVTATGISTAGSEIEHDLDVIIYGTGFAATEFLAPMSFHGCDGAELAQVWEEGAHAYLGITVPRFPNFFLIYGPNTNLGGGSIISMIEGQTGYLAQAVAELRGGGVGALEVRPEVAERYDREMQDRLSHSVWATGCASWYKTESGRVTTNWPGPVEEYRDRTQVFESSDYHRHPVPTSA